MYHLFPKIKSEKKDNLHEGKKRFEEGEKSEDDIGGDKHDIRKHLDMPESVH